MVMTLYRECVTLGYRWWTVKVWRWGVKLGPVSVFAYRWLDMESRLSATFLCGREVVLFRGIPPVRESAKR